MTLWRTPYTLVFTLLPYLCSSQDSLKLDSEQKRLRTFKRTFQFSLFPSISTNGVSSGHYINGFSFNLFGGMSAANTHFELGLLTNGHYRSSTGIQIAGLANLTGGNAFVNLTLWEERTLIHRGNSIDNQGIQLAGMLNYVFNHSTGIQLSGGLNHVGNDFSGVQISGIGNSAGGNSQGVHLSGIYNLHHKSITGIQISTCFNYTDGDLSGSQVSLINKARRMKGKNSTPTTKVRSIQVGIINFSKEMHGTQIGLINFGGDMRGKQIGLFNFFTKFKSKENADAGTPLGLLNLGSFGSVMRIYNNELFAATFENTTGNCQNCTWTPAGPVGMPYTESNKKKNQNALIVSADPIRDRWAFGWGFMKILTDKKTPAPSQRNERRLLSYGVRFLHLNETWSFNEDFNLLNRASLEWGRRYRSRYWFVGIAVNCLIYKQSDATASNIEMPLVTSPRSNFEAAFSPGYSVGIQL